VCLARAGRYATRSIVIAKRYPVDQGATTSHLSTWRSVVRAFLLLGLIGLATELGDSVSREMMDAVELS
jgi:hypothetical protein